MLLAFMVRFYYVEICGENGIYELNERAVVRNFGQMICLLIFTIHSFGIMISNGVLSVKSSACFFIHGTKKNILIGRMGFSVLGIAYNR